MATMLSDIITETRALLMEPTARFFTDAEITRWINYGIRDWSTRVLWYQRIVATRIVANVYEYQLPSDIMKVEMIRFQDKYRIRVVDESEWAQQTFVQAAPAGIPWSALLYPHDKRIALTPPPVTSNAATTLTANINASVTTIPVVSTAGFTSRGRILIGTEQILYFALDGTNFLQCVRGDGDTTPATHSVTDVVDEGKMVIYTRALPPDLVNTTDVPKFPEQWIPALSIFAAYRGEMKRQQPEKANNLLSQYRSLREEAAQERMEIAKDGSFGVKDEELNMGFYGNA